MKKKLLTLGLIIGAIVLALVFFWPSSDKSEMPIDNGYIDSPVNEWHDIGEPDKELPSVNLSTKGTKKVSVTVRDTVHPSTADQYIEHIVEVVVPSEGDPWVSVDGKAPRPQDVRVDAWREPWIFVKPQIMVGGSLNRYVEASLWVGLSVVTVFHRVHLGAGVDRFCVGPAIGYEILDHLTINGQYALVEIHNRPVKFIIGASYIF